MRKYIIIPGVLIAAALVVYYVMSVNINISKIDKLEIVDVQDSTITLSFTASIENTSGKALEIDIEDGKFYKKGEFVGSYNLLHKVKLSGNPTEEIPILVKVKTEKELNLLEDGLTVLLGNTIPVKATGVVNGSWYFLSKKYPFEVEEELSLKKLFNDLYLKERLN